MIKNNKKLKIIKYLFIIINIYSMEIDQKFLFQNDLEEFINMQKIPLTHKELINIHNHLMSKDNIDSTLNYCKKNNISNIEECSEFLYDNIKIVFNKINKINKINNNLLMKFINLLNKKCIKIKY